MVLNWEEIIQNGVFQLDSINDANFTDANYNLRIDKFIAIDGKPDVEGRNEFILKPRGMVVAVSKEIFKMPDDVIAYTTIKNDLSIKGILAINVGIVDPLYEGPISSALVNFGKEDVVLKKDNSFLRMTFHKFEKPKVKKSIPMLFSAKSYYNERKIAAYEYLDETFLNMKSVSDDILKLNKIERKKENKEFSFKLGGIGILIAALSLFLVLFNNMNVKNNSIKTLEEKVIFIESQMQKQNANTGTTVNVSDINNTELKKN